MNTGLNAQADMDRRSSELLWTAEDFGEFDAVCK